MISMMGRCKGIQFAFRGSLLMNANGVGLRNFGKVIGSGGITSNLKFKSATTSFLQLKYFTTDKTETAKKDESSSFKTVQAPHFRTEMQGLSEKEIVENIKKYQSVYDPTRLGARPDEPPIGTYSLPHPIWTKEELENVKITHLPPKGFVEKWAHFSVQCLRLGFDIFSGYSFGKMTENKWLIRIIFLETVAGVPGMVGAMVRHLHSLRRLKRDHGWIHTLLEDAENERMHLMTALHLYKPGFFFRSFIVLSQGIFTNVFFICYLFSPRFCHRFVGYLEEQAVKTYSHCLSDIDKEGGSLNSWKTRKAPKAAMDYWNLGENGTMRDMILAIRADEAHHRLINHTLASIKSEDYNPFPPGKTH